MYVSPQVMNRRGFSRHHRCNLFHVGQSWNEGHIAGARSTTLEPLRPARITITLLVLETCRSEEERLPIHRPWRSRGSARRVIQVSSGRGCRTNRTGSLTGPQSRKRISMSRGRRFTTITSSSTRSLPNDEVLRCHHACFWSGSAGIRPPCLGA